MVLRGDSSKPMPFPDSTFDSVITDPPYGLAFMGKKWDYDIPSVSAFEEILRVAKPGATLLCFAGTRTQHRMACNVEDAGWRLFDTIMWVYGTGFPKAADISKMIDQAAGMEREKVKVPAERVRNPKSVNSGHDVDGGDRPWMKNAKETGYHEMDGSTPATEAAKAWNGWKSHGLKPAYEPIICAMKPNEGTNAENALKWGVAGLAIDRGRIPAETLTGWGGKAAGGNTWSGDNSGLCKDGVSRPTAGRFPANLILGCACESAPPHESGCACAMVDAQSESASRFFYVAKASRTERDRGLEDLAIATPSELTGGRKAGSPGLNDPRAGAGRTSGGRNIHPTTKPLDLMRYLCRLTATPTGGLVLDPYGGSGTTGLAAVLEGRDCILIEREPGYAAIAARRTKT
jgi:site-specific DNA-methyltransferase (adenine-specific)